MALFGSGLSNGSPFYAGYEYTKPELTQPTGLLTLAKYMPETTTASTKKKKADGSDVDEENKMYIPGTAGTQQDLIGRYKNIDAQISSVEAKMKQYFSPNQSSTPQLAVKAITDAGLAKQYAGLLAQKDDLQMAVSQSNNDIGEYKKTVSEFNAKGATGTTAVRFINGIPVGYGVDKSGNINKYGDVLGDMYKENHVVEGDNGKISVQQGKYSDLAHAIGQEGSLEKKIEKIYGTAEKAVSGSGDENLDRETGLIRGEKNTGNYSAIRTAAEDITQNYLEPQEKADLAAQTMDFVKTNGIGNKNKPLLTEQEANAVKKSYTNPNDLTVQDGKDIQSANAKYLTAKAWGKTGEYVKGTSESNLKGGGKGKKEIDANTVNSEQERFQIENESGSFEDKKSNSWELSSRVKKGDLLTTISSPTQGFNAETGQKMKTPMGTYPILKYEEVVNKNGNIEPYVVLGDVPDSEGSKDTHILRIPASEGALSALRSTGISIKGSHYLSEEQVLGEGEKPNTTPVTPSFINGGNHR